MCIYIYNVYIYTSETVYGTCHHTSLLQLLYKEINIHMYWIISSSEPRSALCALRLFFPRLSASGWHIFDRGWHICCHSWLMGCARWVFWPSVFTLRCMTLKHTETWEKWKNLRVHSYFWLLRLQSCRYVCMYLCVCVRFKILVSLQSVSCNFDVGTLGNEV